MPIDMKKEKERNGTKKAFPFWELPIVLDPAKADKKTAAIFPNKIVCHPDLEDTVREGMALVKKANEEDVLQ